MDDFVDIAEASARLGGFAPSNLLRACQSGEIPARQVGGDWIIQRKWLTELEASLNATVAQTIASAASIKPARPPRALSLEDRRQRKAANHFLKRITQQLGELKAEVARLDERLAGLDQRMLRIAQRQMLYRDEARPAADAARSVLQIRQVNGDSSRLD